ncbi:hypothetical protein [Xanthobacter autotrophicus]|uniref:hypothetical protein n=1 Tax=Xanthobacter autotrophicus TaxID=280 RepID=UPI0037289CC6
MLSFLAFRAFRAASCQRLVAAATSMRGKLQKSYLSGNLVICIIRSVKRGGTADPIANGRSKIVPE